MVESNDQAIVGGQTSAQNEAVETVLRRLEAAELFFPRLTAGRVQATAVHCAVRSLSGGRF